MKERNNMRQNSYLRSPKKEEQQLVPEFHQNTETLDEMKGFLGINNSNFDAKLEEDAQICKLEDHFFGNNCDCEEHEFFGWDFFSDENHQEIRDDHNAASNDNNGDEKREIDVGNYCSSSSNNDDNGFCWDDSNNVMVEAKASLKLNLNYEEVLEAWSNRGSLRAQDHHHHHHHHHPSSFMSNNHYMGEVPNLEGEKTSRRETSVLRYKEKRQSRLFSKKIRYEVRKLNADKRPRLKGRFVKRVSNSDNNSDNI